MKIKRTYILNTIDKNILESAIQILDVYAYENNVELEDLTKENMEYFAKRLVSVGQRILAMKKLTDEEEIEVEEDEEDDEEEIDGWCEYCGRPIYESDTQWFAADGSLCCCNECLVAYNTENFPEDDEDEDE